MLISPFKRVALFAAASVVSVFLLPKLNIGIEKADLSQELTISFFLPDASPETVESEATLPLENALSQVSDIKHIYSISNYNQGRISLTFDESVDVDLKGFQVRSVIRKIYAKLPSQLTYPEVEQISINEKLQPVVTYNVYGDLPSSKLRFYASNLLVPEISRISGINKVETIGGSDVKIYVDLDPVATKQNGISYNDVAAIVAENCAGTFSLSASQLNGQRLMVVGDRVTSIEALKEIRIPVNNITVALSEIGKIYFAEAEPKYYQRVNGLNSISLRIYANKSENGFLLAGLLKDKMGSLISDLPGTISIAMENDETMELISQAKENVFKTVISITFILLLIFLVYRGWFPVVALTTTFCATFLLSGIVFYILRTNLNLFNISGLTVFCIVMVNNMIIFLGGNERHSANKKMPVVHSAIVIIALLPLIFVIPEEDRKEVSSLIEAIVILQICFLAVFLWYTPAISTLFEPVPKSTTRIARSFSRHLSTTRRLFIQIIQFLSQRKPILLFLLILMVGTPIFLLPEKWENHEFYNKTLGSKTYQESIRPIVDRTLGGCLRLFVLNAFEGHDFGSSGKTMLYVSARLPHGHTINEMNRVMRIVESHLSSSNIIEKYRTQIASGERGQISISFKDEFETSQLPLELKSDLVAMSLNQSGVEWDIQGIGTGFTTGGIDRLPSFSIKLMGYNYRDLEWHARDLGNTLLQNKRIQDVNIEQQIDGSEKPSAHLRLLLDDKFLRVTGLSWRQVVESVFKPYEIASVPTSISNLDYNTNVFIRLAAKEPVSTSFLKSATVAERRNYFGLHNHVDIIRENAVSAIHKEDRQYLRIVGFNYRGSVPSGNRFVDNSVSIARLKLPDGYSAEKIDNVFSWEKVKQQYGLVILFILSVYLLNTIIFESYWLPMLSIATIPVSFIGPFIVFGYFNYPFNQGGYAAFFLLGCLGMMYSIHFISIWKKRLNKNNVPANRYFSSRYWSLLFALISTCIGLAPFLKDSATDSIWPALAAGTIGGIGVILFWIFIILPAFLIKSRS